MLPGIRVSGRTWRALLCAGACALPGAAAEGPPAPSLEDLAAENRSLRAQVEAQQKLIEQLKLRMDAWEAGRAAPAVPAPAVAAAEPAGGERPPAAAESGGSATVRLSGEAGLAYFATGRGGDYPQGEFRIDEARVYLDAQVTPNAFLHAELDPLTREAGDDGTRMGELYADVEDLWGPAGAVNVRAGRINIPYGEEYQFRNAMENPLIAHSLTDIWGFDNGVEVYGSAGGVSYAGALLSGGINDLSRAHSSFSAAGRIGFDPVKGFGGSVSAMRTGEVHGDRLSAVWFANGFFVGLPGGKAFAVTLEEADLHGSWGSGRVRGAFGQAQYTDQGPGGAHRRTLNYGYLEALQNISDQLYAAVRYSRIAAAKGYPLVGSGNFGEYLFSGELTERLERLTVGAGYRFGEPLVLKIDYSPEWGRTTDGENRGGEQVFATELALKF